MIQLNLFPETKEEQLTRELETLNKKYEKMRKAQFAKISDLKREQDSLKCEFEFLKSAICKNQLDLFLHEYR